MNIKYSLSAILLSSSMLFGAEAFCETPESGVRQSNRVAYSTSANTQVSGSRIYGEWIILSANGRDMNLRDSAPYIDINASDGRIYGDVGGNVVNACFEIPERGHISVSEIEMTHLPSAYICEEDDIKTGLGDACSYTITKKKNDIYYLDLLDKRGNVVVHAKRHNADVMTGMWRIDKINGNEIEGSNLEIVVDVPELKIHGKTGCNIFNGDIGLDRNKDWFIQFQNIIVSRMKCEDSKMAVERDFMVALEEAEIIKRENGGKTIRLLDRNKKEVLLLKRIQQ